MYSSAERELVYRWGEKWFELISLINKVISTAEPPQAIHELKYQELRSWLMDHRALFVPLWEDFYKLWKSRQGLINEATGNTNPFGAFPRELEGYKAYEISAESIPPWQLPEEEEPPPVASVTPGGPNVLIMILPLFIVVAIMGVIILLFRRRVVA